MSFRLRCVANFKADMGRFDAIVEFTELSVRDFIKTSNEAISFDDFIIGKSEEHSIRVNSVDQHIFRSRISQSYILSVYQTAEACFHSFKDDLEDMRGTIVTLENSSSDYLTKLVRSIAPTNEKQTAIGRHRLALFDYYRTVRNKYSHDFIADAKIEDAFARLNIHHQAINKEYAGLDAPNDFDGIIFDDFILFSRVCKDIITEMNNLIKPEFSELVAYYEKKELFKKYDNKPSRKKNALKAHINDTFGLADDEATNLVNHLLH